MKTKIICAALALALSPSVALAMGCGKGHAKEASISCAEGTIFDNETQKCVPTSS